MENIRIRSFRFMLYPDNYDHMRTFKIIQRSRAFKYIHAGIWHTSGKKHCHLILRFDSPHSWYQLLKDTSCDDRFCRPIGYMVDKKNPDKWRRCAKNKDSFELACAYLPHFTDQEKEQYSVKDIFGNPPFVDVVRNHAIQYKSRNISQAECLQAARTWIVSNFGKRITSSMFMQWVTNSPYMKIVNSGLVQRMIEEHNYTVAYQESRRDEFDIEMARLAYEERITREREKERYELLKGYENGTIEFEEILF